LDSKPRYITQELLDELLSYEPSFPNMERDVTILKMRLGMDYEREYTLIEIAGQFGLSRERVRQIARKIDLRVKRMQSNKSRAIEAIKAREIKAKKIEAIKAEIAASPHINVSLEECLNLSVRANKCLLNAGVNTVGELIKHSPDSLLRIANLGKLTLQEIEDELEKLGLSLSQSNKYVLGSREWVRTIESKRNRAIARRGKLRRSLAIVEKKIAKYDELLELADD